MSQSHSQPHSQRILIAEDNVVMADVVRFNLEREGYFVTHATTGLQAWNILEEECFDLLITDFQMPQMNGDQLCQAIRDEPRHSEMTILMCSAKAFELDAARIKDELNISKLIYKPFSPIELKKTVLQIFETKEQKTAVV